MEINQDKVFYVWSQTKPNFQNIQRKVCMAGIVDGTKLKIGVAQLNPIDKHRDSKELGRTIALGRINKNKAMFTIDIFRENEQNNIASPKEIVAIMHEHAEQIPVKENRD
jgi:hypothetical protein